MLPIPPAGSVPDRGRMTTTTSPTTTRLARLRRSIADVIRAQETLWATTERIAPDPDPYLHWEPTTAGWRLYGRLVPPD